MNLSYDFIWLWPSPNNFLEIVKFTGGIFQPNEMGFKNNLSSKKELEIRKFVKWNVWEINAENERDENLKSIFDQTLRSFCKLF